MTIKLKQEEIYHETKKTFFANHIFEHDATTKQIIPKCQIAELHPKHLQPALN